jgi:hypothetical protein
LLLEVLAVELRRQQTWAVVVVQEDSDPRQSR